MAWKKTRALGLLLSWALILGCWREAPLSPQALEKEVFTLKTATGQPIRTSLALSLETKARGLSGVRPGDFAEDRGMLFIFAEEDRRSFWMPDTYFDLDIIFLDKHLAIVALERNVPHHPGRKEPPPIYTTNHYRAKYVLEIRARSPLSAHIKVGDTLTWDSTPSLEQIQKSLGSGRN